MPSTDIRPRLLVVDDELSIGKLIKRFARPLGFEVECRTSGQEALACIADVRPDVALIDLGLAGSSGIDVLRAIRAAHPVCQVILMTGRTTVETTVEAISAGALDCLSKPLDFGRLLELLVVVRERIPRR